MAFVNFECSEVRRIAREEWPIGTERRRAAKPAKAVRPVAQQSTAASWALRRLGLGETRN